MSGVGPEFEDGIEQYWDMVVRASEQDDKERVRSYGWMTGKFPGKAEKDDWADQAKELMNNRNNQ